MMCHKNVKNIKFVAIKCILSSSRRTKTRFRPGLRWREDTPFHTILNDAYGVPISAPTVPSKQNSWPRLWMKGVYRYVRLDKHKLTANGQGH